MDLKTLLAAAPWIKKAWRVVPAPLRIPLLVVAFVVWLVNRRDGATDPSTGSTAGSSSPSPSEAA